MPTTLKERRMKAAAATRAYYKKYPERRKASQARYYERNSELIKSRARARYALQRAAGTTYYQRNTELVKARSRMRYYHDRMIYEEAQASMREAGV